MPGEFYAYHDFDCEKCGDVILDGEEFKFFDGNKICMVCWDKLVDFFDNEM